LVYKELGKHGQAIYHFEKALALNPSYVRAYHNLGVVYHLKGDLKRAIKNYQVVLSLDRGNLSSLNNLGLIYREEQRLYDARDVLEKALELKPAFPQTQYNLALVLEGLGEYEQARIHYQQFVALTGHSNRALAEKVEVHLRTLPQQKK
jgi:tetratricopeptide (TPR) repeat protein